MGRVRRRDAAARPGSLNGVALEAPIVALGLFQHLPEGALPLASFLVLLLDPQRHLHHASRDVPIAPQRLHGLVVVSRPGRLVEERAPSILVLAPQLNLLQRILGLPLLHLLADLPHRRLCGDRDREHAQGGEHLDLWYVVLVPFGDLCGTLLNQAALLIPNLAVRRCVLGENNLLSFLLCHRLLNASRRERSPRRHLSQKWLE